MLGVGFRGARVQPPKACGLVWLPKPSTGWRSYPLLPVKISINNQVYIISTSQHNSYGAFFSVLNSCARVERKFRVKMKFG